MDFPSLHEGSSVGFFKLILAGLVAATIASGTVCVLLVAEVVSPNSFKIAMN